MRPYFGRSTQSCRQDDLKAAVVRRSTEPVTSGSSVFWPPECPARAEFPREFGYGPVLLSFECRQALPGCGHLGAVQPWACDIYNHPYGTQSSRYCPVNPPESRIAQAGCALTGLTMSLDTAGLSYDPGTLNTFKLDPQHPSDYGDDHGV
jgi:hypothetical protein